MSYIRDTITDFTTGLVSQEISVRKDIAGVKNGLLAGTNWNIRPSGGAYYRDGLKFVGESTNGDGELVPFDYNSNDNLMLLFTENQLEFMKDGAFIQSGGSNYSITTPYSAEEAKELRYIRYYNDMYLVHKSHDPRKLERLADDNWSLSVENFNPDNVPQARNLSAINKYSKTITLAYDWEYAVSCLDNDLTVGFPVTVSSTGCDIDLQEVPIEFSFEPPADVTNVSKYYIFRKTNGVYSLIGTILEDGSSSYSLVDANIAEDSTIQPPIEFTDFDGDGNKPSAITVYGQRMVMAGSINSPARIWFSNVGQFPNFSDTNAALDSEGFKRDLVSEQSSVIENLLNFGTLFIGSRDTLWSGNGYTKSEIQFTPSDYEGASSISPLKTKFSIIYAGRNGTSLYDYIYSNESNFVSSDLTLKAKDWFEDKQIKKIIYSSNPEPTIFCIMDDGTIMLLLYIKDQDLTPWTRMVTDGEFISAGNLIKDKKDNTYFLIKRGSKYYVELYERTDITNVKVEDSKNLDSYVYKESETAFTTVEGVGHLAGKTVGIIYDGNYISKDLAEGETTITLPIASKKACVGLFYDNVLQTVSSDYINDNSAIKSTIDISRKISYVNVNYKNAKDFKISTNGVDYQGYKLTDIDEMGLVSPLITGNKRINTTASWDKGVSVYIKQNSPFPTIIQSLTFKIQYGKK